MSNEGQNLGRVPFELGEKIGSGTTAEVFESVKNPNLVVKKFKIIWAEGDESENYSEETFKRIFKRNFDQMAEAFGEYFPKGQLVFGEEEKGQTVGYLIQEKIFKDRPLFFTKEKKQKLEALDSVLSHIVENFKRLSAEKEKVSGKLGTRTWNYLPEMLSQDENKETRVTMPDFMGPDDMVYGHTADNPKPRYLLHDIYRFVAINQDNLLKFVKSTVAFKIYDFPKTRAALESLKSIE